MSGGNGGFLLANWIGFSLELRRICASGRRRSRLSVRARALPTRRLHHTPRGDAEKSGIQFNSLAPLSPHSDVHICKLAAFSTESQFRHSIDARSRWCCECDKAEFFHHSSCTPACCSPKMTSEKSIA